jgi:hypothetical protein
MPPPIGRTARHRDPEGHAKGDGSRSSLRHESASPLIATICSVALCFVPASAAVVGQMVSVSNPTMACPSDAALERFRKASADNPARASKDALTAGCREVDPSEQGLIGKVAGADLCVIFTSRSGACLWIPASAPAGRINPGASQTPGPINSSFPALSDAIGGLQRLFGGSH